MIAKENPYPFTVYTEDLMWMSEEGFTYYFPSYVAACKIVCNQKGKEHVESLCSGILTAIAFRAEAFAGSIKNNKEIVIEFINFIEKEAEEMISNVVYNNKLSEIKKTPEIISIYLHFNSLGGVFSAWVIVGCDRCDMSTAGRQPWERKFEVKSQVRGQELHESSDGWTSLS